MKEATVIYPHQLFAEHPAIAKNRPIYLVEEPLLLNEFATHNQKLLLHRLSLQAYKKRLEEGGHKVTYLSLSDISYTDDVFTTIAQDGIHTVHIVDTTDNWLEKRITQAAKKHTLTRISYESPLFILTKDSAIARYKQSKKSMAAFYKQLRKDKRILLDGENPTGGKWSFDEDNRKKVPKNVELPDDITTYQNAETLAAQTWLEKLSGERYGETNVWLPHTHEGAQAWLHAFLEERFANFGTYEDAIVGEHTRLYHSTISPLLNIGLLTPQDVLSQAVIYGESKNIPLNNIEGFVRQILGWREFIRASYECDGSQMRTKNFWHHTRPLPKSFWSGTTGIVPIDISIKKALLTGYNHHIERLMVLGNFMLLTQTKPDDAYRWFMAMYVDAYDWVMVPNVYGMSQFADGGNFATKPYISGSNYLKKMSDYPKGDWEDTWTALYWNFIALHTEFFTSNHRLSMMPRLLEKMNTEKRNSLLKTARDYLENSQDIK